MQNVFLVMLINVCKLCKSLHIVCTYINNLNVNVHVCKDMQIVCQRQVHLASSSSSFLSQHKDWQFEITEM